MIVDFNHETAQKVFGGEIKSHVLMFLSKEAGHYEKYLDSQKENAKTYKDRVLFVSINTDDEDHGRILEFFGMKKEEVPAARLIKLADEMAKYKPATQVLDSADDMKTWVESFLDGKLKVRILDNIFCIFFYVKFTNVIFVSILATPSISRITRRLGQKPRENFGCLEL